MKDDDLDTAYLLAMRYRKPVIELSEVCRHYLNITTPSEMNRKAAAQAFPFPVFRADPANKKSPYLVKISALAAWLDTQAEQGQREWEKVNS